MRTFAIAAALVVAGDRLHSCGSGATDADPDLTVALAFPDGPGSHGVSTLGCGDWALGFGPDRLSGRPGRSACAVVGWRRDGQLIVKSTPFQFRRSKS